MEPAKEFNRWEKVNVLLAFLTPLAIAGAGYYLNEQAQERAAELSLQQIAIAKFNADREDKRERLALIPSFMDALTGQDPKDQIKKDFAIKTISAILPDEGPALLVGLKRDASDISPENKTVIDNAAIKLVGEVFSDSYATRDRAFSALVSNTMNDESVIRSLLVKMKDDPKNADGVVNGLELLNRFPSKSLTPFSAELREVFPLVSPNGSKTDELTKAIETKVGIR